MPIFQFSMFKKWKKIMLTKILVVKTFLEHNGHNAKNTHFFQKVFLVFENGHF